MNRGKTRRRQGTPLPTESAKNQKRFVKRWENLRRELERAPLNIFLAGDLVTLQKVLTANSLNETSESDLALLEERLAYRKQLLRRLRI